MFSSTKRVMLGNLFQTQKVGMQNSLIMNCIGIFLSIFVFKSRNFEIAIFEHAQLGCLGEFLCTILVHLYVCFTLFCRIGNT